MKKLLFIIMLLPVFTFGQSLSDKVIPYMGSINDLKPKVIFKVNSDSTEITYAGEIYRKETIFTEWQKYLNDCNELVPDTIRQSGIVKCDLVPVKMNGKIVSYNTVPTDTIWSECNCDDYKTIDFSSRNFTVSGDFISVTSGGWATSSVYSEPEWDKNTFLIKRNKICMIKKRKASFNDFFERWLVEKKLVKFN